MIGIEAIASFIPEERVSPLDRCERFGLDDDFVRNKIGFVGLARKRPDQIAADLGLKAVSSLMQHHKFVPDDIDIMALVTQTPGEAIPHGSAVIHNQLGLGNSCMCFDISQGCSGYVHGLSIVRAIMEQQGFKRGLLITSDPYSDIVDEDDKNTALIFGDGASVTLLGPNPVFDICAFDFGTSGCGSSALHTSKNRLRMNGREIFNFTQREVVPGLKKFLHDQAINSDDVDLFALHQGSKYVVNHIAREMGVTSASAPFLAAKYGNLVSSSIPVILEKEFSETKTKTIVLCGFGVGLSWGVALIRRMVQCE